MIIYLYFYIWIVQLQVEGQHTTTEICIRWTLTLLSLLASFTATPPLQLARKFLTGKRSCEFIGGGQHWVFKGTLRGIEASKLKITSPSLRLVAVRTHCGCLAGCEQRHHAWITTWITFWVNSKHIHGHESMNCTGHSLLYISRVVDDLVWPSNELDACLTLSAMLNVKKSFT